MRLFPAVFVVTTCTTSFQRDRGQLINAMMVGSASSIVGVAVAVGVADEAVVFGSEMM